MALKEKKRAECVCPARPPTNGCQLLPFLACVRTHSADTIASAPQLTSDSIAQELSSPSKVGPCTCEGRRPQARDRAGASMDRDMER
jgi:hypothetical protein